MEDDDAKLSIYRAARTIKRRDNCLYNALRSIYEDSIFIGEISQLWPELPLVANLRCGLWYYSKFHSTCYFKSTDGHTNNLSFNTSRLNLHIAQLAARSGGCMIVDSTRKGKRFPDSMSKTIPIWTCVLNRCIRKRLSKIDGGSVVDSMSGDSNACTPRNVSVDWDCSLHLPLWVSKTEQAAIEKRLEEWTENLEQSGADIGSLVMSLKKPLRPLWISQRSVIWLNEVPDHDSWDFTPIILVSASSSTGFSQIRTTSEHSWNYIAGAGDDEESWARGLTPNLFWSNAYDLISSGPESCNQRVAEMVEKDRVYRSLRGLNAPQVIVKSEKSGDGLVGYLDEDSLFALSISNPEIGLDCGNGDQTISWIGETNLGVGTSQAVTNLSNVDRLLNCDTEAIDVALPDHEAYLHLPILTSKFDRFSLLNNLPFAVQFAKMALSKGRKLLICCHNGEDISICICLAILISLFDETGNFDNGSFFSDRPISKIEMRRRLVLVCRFAVNARPSRGNLKQVFSFLRGERVDSTIALVK